MYLFTSQTHYCYYQDTHVESHASLDHHGNIQYCSDHESNTRFHGDCQWHLKEAAKKGELADQNLFPTHYYCVDIVKNAQVEETKDQIIKTNQKDLLHPAQAVQIADKLYAQAFFPLPEVNCRSGPRVPIPSLRGPPLV